jgi:hypothetical protein
MNKTKEESRMKKAETIPARRARATVISSFYMLHSSFLA